MMKETPLVQIHPLIPLQSTTSSSAPPSNVGNGDGGGSRGGGGGGTAAKKRRIIASLTRTSNDHHAAADGSIGVTLTEVTTTTSGNNGGPLMTELISVGNNDGGAAVSQPLRRSDADGLLDASEELFALRGLSSTHYSKLDNRVIFTHGVAGRRGLIRICVRDDAAAVGGRGGEQSLCDDIEVDISSIMNDKVRGSNLFEGPVVGTAVFVTQNKQKESREDNMDTGSSSTTTGAGSLLHLRAVDPYGTILSLTLSYPSLQPLGTPTATFSSFVLQPLSIMKDNERLLRPHPGSSIENSNGVCFPTPWTVVFALNPHLYCVDLGGGGAGAVTRVWTNVHRVTSDPIADSTGGDPIADSTGGDSGAVGATPRKKAKKGGGGLGSLLTGAAYTLMGVSDYGAEEAYEYDDDDDKENGGYISGIPSIAALANLNSNNCDNNVARVATLHSDGSLRIWTAHPSKKDSAKGQQLRIPSVQRVAISQTLGGWTSSEVSYVDVPLPDPSTWDPCRDALTLGGSCVLDGTSGTVVYEVAVHVQCYSRGRKPNANEAAGSMYVLKGAIVDSSQVDDETRALPSGDTAELQTLNVPEGTTSVVDVAWSNKRDLVVLFRRGSDSGDGSANESPFYDVGEENEGKATLAIYPLTKNRGSLSYAKEAVLPSNMTLPYLDFNHFGYEFGMSAEEELDRYLTPSEGDQGDEMEDAEIAKAEARVDRAGLLAILQPFGRNRSTALAVHRAMSSLNLLDNGVTSDEICPAAIVAAMRKWKKRSTFQSTSAGFASTALVPVVDNNEARENDSVSSPVGGLSIYHAFASASKSSAKKSITAPGPGVGRQNNVDDHEYKSAAGVNQVEAARQAHRWKWIRLLSEIRSHESRLDEVLCLGGASTSGNFLIRSGAISVLVLDTDASSASTLRNTREGEITSRLDELCVTLLEGIASNPELRGLLSKVESLLYDSASKASSLVEGWAQKECDIELLSQVELLGGMAMMQLSVTDAQLGLLSDLSQLGSNAVDSWLDSTQSTSSSVVTRLAISKPTVPQPDATTASTTPDALSSAASLVASQLESARQLSLSRLLFVFGFPQKNSPSVQNCALRSALYRSSLSWAIHQPSSGIKSRTVLEEFLSSGMTTNDATAMADAFIVAVFRDETTLTSPSREPRVALRLLAPLVEFPLQSAAAEMCQKRKEATAECLLAEAAMIAKQSKSSANDTSPECLWRIASELLHSDSPNSLHRARSLESHLDLMEGSESLPSCCSVVLGAIHDAISKMASTADPSVETTETISALWESAFQTSMRGHLWDDAFRACVSNQSVEKRSNLKRLILGMVDAGALGKIVDMSLSVVGRELSSSNQEGAAAELDLFDLASNIIEEAAVEQASVSLASHMASDVENRPNYWGCLYALHASRGNWRQAASAMDMCGKAVANSVSSSKSESQTPLVLSKSASKKIMDDACLSAQACLHAISLVDKPSQRYLLPPNKDIPSESRLLTEEDLERRASRALALRSFFMDEYSPDSVSSILESTSRDTIDSLARFGYYDQAIEVAKGVSSKRKGCLPGGVDLFDDALRYILCTYLVPVAMKPHLSKEDGALESLQARSKIAQIRASSSVCALDSDSMPQSCVDTSNVNSKSFGSNSQSVKALQSAMAMDLLRQYTTVYSKRCYGLGLHVANATLRAGEGMSSLPVWLKELCMFGIPGEETKNGLFAQPAGKNNGTANPAGLMRLYIKHHLYGDACDVVTSILSKQLEANSRNASSRLPEKGSVDYVPYDLIDMLYNMIESIISSNSATSSQAAKTQVKSLQKKRSAMEKALQMHFESLKISEEGLKSTRRLSSA